MKGRSFFDKIVFAINSLFAVFLLCSCAVPFISVEYFPILSVLSLLVPFFVLVNILCLIYWLFRKKKQHLLSLVVLLCGYLFLEPFFKFNFSETTIQKKDLSMMSFNARNFNKYDWIDDSSIGDQIIDFIKEQAPDILCFQEFSRTRESQLSNYPYKYVTPKSEHKSTQAIFSKYPIIADGSLDFPDSPNNALFADILYNKDTIRVYNVHLESLRIRPDAKTLAKEPSARLYKRLSKSFAKQQQQARILEEHKKKTPYGKIVCGDFNNTQFSNVYRVVRGKMQDTFEEKGSGYGRTYNFKYFPVRIDFILVDPGFEVKAHKNYRVKLSDHFPVMASISVEAH